MMRKWKSPQKLSPSLFRGKIKFAEDVDQVQPSFISFISFYKWAKYQNIMNKFK